MVVQQLHTLPGVSSNLTFTTNASETWKSERSYKPFSARLAFLRGFDPLRWYQNNGSVAEWSMALVLKTKDPKGSVSSNLTASANFKRSLKMTAEEYWKWIHDNVQ